MTPIFGSNAGGETAATGAGNLPGRRGPVAAILHGAIGFALVAVGAFSVWAFGERWFRTRGGEGAMYAAIAVVFVALAGILLHPLVEGSRRVMRFYAAFAPAFLAYSVVWSAFWFWLKAGAGEWLGAAAGSAVFVAITAWRFGRLNSFWPAALAFFIMHTAGYFAGGKAMGLLMEFAKGQADPMDRAQWRALAKLSWGVCYGLGFGAGLGHVYHAFQRPRH